LRHADAQQDVRDHLVITIGAIPTRRLLDGLDVVKVNVLADATQALRVRQLVRWRSPLPVYRNAKRGRVGDEDLLARPEDGVALPRKVLEKACILARAPEVSSEDEQCGHRNDHAATHSVL
jgi:hypothetical protein